MFHRGGARAEHVFSTVYEMQRDARVQSNHREMASIGIQIVSVRPASKVQSLARITDIIGHV
jgi:hypothetical protein